MHRAIGIVERTLESGKYDKKVYPLISTGRKGCPIALEKIGVKLTKLSKEQAEYINVLVEGPFKLYCLQILNISSR